MRKVKKKSGFVQIEGRQPMNREQYESFRAERKKYGEYWWPPYDQISEEDPEHNPDDDPSPSP